MDAFDIYQQHRIRRTDERIRFNEQANDHRHQRARDEVVELHTRIDRLLLVNEALWQLVRDRTGLTDHDLAAKLHQLDSLDGKPDGRRQPNATDCSCGAKVNPKAPRCVFCGAAAPVRSPFDTI